MSKPKVWCGGEDWHGRHGWQLIDEDDQPLSEWHICDGYKPPEPERPRPRITGTTSTGSLPFDRYRGY